MCSLARNRVRNSTGHPSSNSRRSADSGRDGLREGWTPRVVRKVWGIATSRAGSGTELGATRGTVPWVDLGGPLLSIAYGQQTVYN